MEPHGFIYMTTNQVNGKKYIGQSSYSKRNWRTYLGSGKVLKAALKKYGKQNFTREIIMNCFTKEDTDFMERHFIEFHDAMVSTEFYNISPGGKASLGFTGKKLSPEHLAAIKDKCQNRVISDRLREQSKINGLSNRNKRYNRSAGKGKDHPKSIQITIDGIEYETLSAAAKATNLSHHQVRKIAGLYKSKPRKQSPNSIPIVIDGIEYISLSVAAKSTAYTLHQIRKLAGLY